MAASAIKNNQGHFEHSDVLRVIGHSHTSFDDAVASALQQLANPTTGHNHHPDLKFVRFTVFQLSGAIEHDVAKKSCEVVHYSATIDVEAQHEH